MCNSNVQTIKNQFERYIDITKNESLETTTNQLLNKYVLTRSATSLSPLRELKQRNNENKADENINFNNPKFNIQRSLTSLDMLNTSTINRNLKDAIEKVTPTKTVDTKNIKLTNKELKTNTNIYGKVGPLVEKPHKPITRLCSELNSVTYCSESLIYDSTNNNISAINKSSAVLSRQLSDPLKKGNIKRTPAFRCEKSFIRDGDQLKYNVQSNLSNRIKMFEENQTRNKANQVSLLVPEKSKMNSNCNSKLMISETNSGKFISLSQSKRNGHKISYGSVHLDAPIKANFQKTNEVKKSQCIKYKSPNSANSMKSKTNHLIKTELETITKQKHGCTSSLKKVGNSKINELLHNSNLSHSNLDPFKSSNDLNIIPIKIIPEYSQVVKSKVPDKNLKTFSKKDNRITKISKQNVNIYKEKKSSIENHDNLTDTLRKALKSPLPNGPPPKKPPRTFAHSPISKKNTSHSDVPSKIPTREIASLRVLSDKELKHTKNDPKLMLDKLEYALLNNKIKSPKVDHKILNVSEPMNVTHTSFLNMSKIDFILTQNKNNSEIKQNIIDASTYNVAQKTLLLDCFPIICKNNNYTEIKGLSEQSKSEFFVSCQTTEPTIKPTNHIYAEPFEFERKVSFSQNNSYIDQELNNAENSLKKSCDNNIKNILKKFEQSEFEEYTSKPGLHYLCTPVHSFQNSYEELNNIKLFNENITTVTVDPVKLSDEQSSNKNKLFDDKITREKLHHIMSLAYNFTTNSNFDTISTILTNGTHKKTMSTSVNLDKTANMLEKEKSKNSFIHNMTSDMKQLNVMDDEKGSNEPFVRTGSGRVKTLRQQFEIGVNKNSSMSSKTEDMIVNVPKKIKRHSNISQKYNTCNKEPIPKQNNTSQKIYDLEKSKLAEIEKSVSTEDDLLKLVSKEIIGEINSDSLAREHFQNIDLDVSRRKRHELSKSLSVKHKMYVKRVSSKVDKYKKMVVQTSCAPNLFDCCFLVGLNISNKTPYIKMKYPENYKLPSSVEMFCFPDASHWNWLHTIPNDFSSDIEKNQIYSLVLTDENGNRTFGFCRRVIPEGTSLCLPLTYCVLTPFRAMEFYSRILKELESRHGLPDMIFMKFLRNLHKTPFPRPGESVSLSCHVTEPVLIFPKDPNYEPIEIGRQIVDNLENDPLYGNIKKNSNTSKLLEESLEKQNDLNYIEKIDLNERMPIVFKHKQEPQNFKPKNGDEDDFVFISHDLKLNSSLQVINLSNKKSYNIDETTTNEISVKKDIGSYSLPLNENNDLFKTTICLTREFDSRSSERDLITLCNSLQLSTIIQIFGSLLLERKVVLVCKSISKLSVCIQALQSMLYPFSWQHTYVPVLPSTMLDILNAPTPFVIGVLEAALEEDLQIDEGIAVNLDKDMILCSIGDELAILPDRIIRSLKIGLSSITTKSPLEDSSKNVLISEAFINIFVEMLGNYRQFIKVKNRMHHFEKEAFINSNNSKTIQLFLEWFTETAMFNAFLDSFLNSTDICVNYEIFLQRIFEHRENSNKKKTFTEKFKKWNLFS